MMIQTIDGVLNEPIGAFTEEEEADKWLEECKKCFSNNTTAFSILPIEVDTKPPLLEITSEISEKNIAYQLTELYNQGIRGKMWRHLRERFNEILGASSSPPNPVF